MPAFFEKFQRLCADKEISLAAAAEEMGFSNSTTTKWSRGSVPSGRTLRTVAKYFDVSVDYLMGDEPQAGKTVSGWDLYDFRCDANNIQCTMEVLIDSLDREVCALLIRSKTEENVMARNFAELFAEKYMPVLQLLNENMHNLARGLEEVEEVQYAKAEKD